MAFSSGRCLPVLVLLITCAALAHPQNARKPLGDAELLALVAGNALSENIVHEIESRGLAFNLSSAYRAQLTDSGASAPVLTALSKAKVSDLPKGPGSKVAAELLQRLATAGKLMGAKKDKEAAEELIVALQSNGGPEAGFVMGEILRRQEQWEMAMGVYAQVLEIDPAFPEVHTKLSYILYRLGEAEAGLREAKKALAVNPENAEAHKNAGLALESLRKFDAGVADYREALRIKPDYQVVHYDLGLLLYKKGDLDGSIGEYRKAVALDPNDVDAYFNMAISCAAKGDLDCAIREGRAAKKVDPTRTDVRQNLSADLIRRNLDAEAIVELRELEALAPDMHICHQCLGLAMHKTWDLQGAEKEFRKAADMDPSDPNPHIGLGGVYKEQKFYDAALKEYRRAQELDPDSVDAHVAIGRVLLETGKIPGALQELREAVRLGPANATAHDLYGRALAANGDPKGAISELRESIALDSNDSPVRLELAAALEKEGNWPGAFTQYHQAIALDMRKMEGPDHQHMTRELEESKKRFQEAKNRLDRHLAALKASGKNKEAEDLEAKVRATEASTGPSEKLDAAMQEGMQALRSNQLDRAEKIYQEALPLAEKLQPRDGRLVTIYNYLGSLHVARKDFPGAQASFERQLQAAQEVFGQQSPAMADALQALGTNALFQQDYPVAEKFLSRSLALNEQIYGENNARVSGSIRLLSTVPAYQKDYPRAEALLLRSLKIDESLFGSDSPGLFQSWASLCGLYEQWDKPEKLEPCNRHLLASMEKQAGENSPMLVPVLKKQANALRKLGRPEEATKFDERAKSLQAPTQPN